MEADETEEALYFEQQGKFSSLCAVHAINNLLGQTVSSEQHLNQICKTLSKDLINPHKHLLGGDYDANVIMIALQELGYQCSWLDSRQLEFIVVDCSVQNPRRVGYLVNRKMKSNPLKSFLGLSQRHWMSVRKVDQKYFQLDSQSSEKKPKQIQSLPLFLENELVNESHLFEVLKK